MAEEMTKLSLDDWLEHIRQETPLQEVPTRVLFRDPPYRNADRPAEPDQAAQALDNWRGFSKDVSQRIKELLTILWSDIEFWKRVSKDEQEFLLLMYSVKCYGLAVPSVPSKVWVKMAKRRRFRDQVFELLATQHWRLITWRRLLGVGEEEKIIALFKEHLDTPAFDKRTLITAKGFPPDTLELLAESAQDLATDMKWLIKHPEQNPPVGFRRRRGRPHSVEHAEELEKLVELIKQNPTKSNPEIAKMFDPKAVALAANRKEKGRPVSDELVTQRKNAGEARLLAIVRDGAKVARYVD